MLGNKCSITFAQRQPDGRLLQVHVIGEVDRCTGEDLELHHMLLGLEIDANASGRYRTWISVEEG